MRRLLLAGLVITGVVLAESPAPALRVAIPNYSTSQKVAQSDAVVSGKVMSIEKETVELPQYAGDKNKVAFTVAVVKVESALAGVKNVTHIKVAFLAQPATITPVQPGGGPILGRPIGGRVGPVQLTEGQEGIFFLQKHPGSDTYYSVQQGFAPISAQAENYKDEVAKIKASTEAIADPVKALKAEKLADRLTALTAILAKYRQPVRGVASVEVAIPAEETKLIIKTLLEADWTAGDMPAAGFDYQSSAPNIANMIGLFPGANGIPQIAVKPGESYNAKLKETLATWYQKNGEKFEIKKYVAKK